MRIGVDHHPKYGRSIADDREVKKKPLASDVPAALTCRENTCFQPVSLEVCNIDTGKSELLDISSGSFSKKQDSSSGPTLGNDDDKANFFFIFKGPILLVG